jgi:membrane protein insertase Oxa1/YidC/SpoIIIJ
MIDLLYITSFFIIGIILYLILKDLKKLKPDLFQKIDNSVWGKLYILMMISTLHFIWLFYSIFLDYKDDNYIFGIPIYLGIIYIIFIILSIINLKNTNDETDSTIIIDRLLNYIFASYTIIIIGFILIPVPIKKEYIKYANNIIHEFLYDK